MSRHSIWSRRSSNIGNSSRSNAFRNSTRRVWACARITSATGSAMVAKSRWCVRDPDAYPMRHSPSDTPDACRRTARRERT